LLIAAIALPSVLSDASVRWPANFHALSTVQSLLPSASGVGAMTPSGSEPWPDDASAFGSR